MNANINVTKIIKEIIVFLGVLFIGVFLHVSLFGNIEIGVVTPNILLILTSAYGFMHGGIYGMLFGFLSGIIVDCYSPDYFGINCLIFLFIGFLNGLLTRFFFGDDIRLPLLLIGISDIIYGVCMYLFLFLVRGRYDFYFYFMNIIMPEAVYGAIVFLIFYSPLLKLFRWINMDNTRRLID